MSRPRPTSVLVLAVALFVGAGPYLVRAAGTGQAATGTANIDMARLIAESDARKAASLAVQTYAQTASRRYDETAALAYLTMDEIERYSEALNAQTPTDAQKKTMADVKAESAKRAGEVRTLSAKKEADLTAAERTRLRELISLEQQRPASLEGLKRIYQNLVQEEDARQARAAARTVRDIVAKLAAEQGIAQVFDSSSLVVAPVDLTTMALARVKKK